LDFQFVICVNEHRFHHVRAIPSELPMADY
jgi:hypothetical protein